jgi:hypothetical protein
MQELSLKIKPLSVDGPCWDELVGLKLTYANGQTLNYPDSIKKGLKIKTALNKMKVDLMDFTWPSGTVTFTIDGKQP